MLQTVYLVLCAVGIVIPYRRFVAFLLSGRTVPQFIVQLFANRIASLTTLDLIIVRFNRFCDRATSVVSPYASAPA